MTCGGDRELRDELESLLRSHRRGGPFLDAPVVVFPPQRNGPAKEPELVGRRIGRDELVRVIAEGGMGIVYEALQEEPRRVVAVKIMQRGLTPVSPQWRSLQEHRQQDHPRLDKTLPIG